MDALVQHVLEEIAMDGELGKHLLSPGVFRGGWRGLSGGVRVGGAWMTRRSEARSGEPHWPWQRL